MRVDFKYLITITITLCFCISKQALSQDTIYLQNPSFEAYHYNGFYQRLDIWRDLVVVPNSPPTIHGSEGIMYKVTHEASDKKHFVGMVTRYDSTWEGITQLLDAPLKKDFTYSFEIDLCTSLEMKSATRRTTDEANISKSSSIALEDFHHGAIIRLQGSHSRNGANEVLYKSIRIEHEDWRRYSFEFTPQGDYDIFIIEVFYDMERAGLQFLNANILLDNCGPIIQQH